MAAKETTLNILHEKIAQSMLARLDSATAESPLTAAEMTAITKFLKDNGIQADPEEDETTKKLVGAAGNILQMPFKAVG